MQPVFGDMQKLLYLCEVKIQKAFIDACFGVLNPARFFSHPKQDGDRCPRGMYPLHPHGVCTYRRGLMLFILVAGSCRNLRIENKQVSGLRFFVCPISYAARRNGLATQTRIASLGRRHFSSLHKINFAEPQKRQREKLKKLKEKDHINTDEDHLST